MKERRLNLYILFGILGSGKSTWAFCETMSSARTKCVCMDDIRYMLHKRKIYVASTDQVVLKISQDAVKRLLAEGYDVVVDCGNLTEGVRQTWLNVAGEAKKILVKFPLREKKWHVNHRMEEDTKGKNRKYWEDWYDMQVAQIEPPREEDYDSVIKARKRR